MSYICAKAKAFPEAIGVRRSGLYHIAVRCSREGQGGGDGAHPAVYQSLTDLSVLPVVGTESTGMDCVSVLYAPLNEHPVIEYS